jgi:hypothetical protein
MTTETHQYPARPKPLGVGMPFWLLLHQFGAMVDRAFGCYPYLVGSALSTRTPRDIDVRLILSDDDFHQRFQLSTLNQPLTGWADTCLVWSSYGTILVGKTIDFQIQNITHNAHVFAGHPRLIIGVAVSSANDATSAVSSAPVPPVTP